MPRHRKRNLALWLALLLSALAHAFTFSGGWLTLPQTKPDPASLTARLQPAPPVAQPAVPSIPVAKPVAPRPAKVAAAPATARADVPPVPMATTPFTPPAAQAAPETEPVAPDMSAQADTPAFEPVVVATAAPSTFTPEPAQIKNLPRRGRIAYDLNYYLSDAPTLVGRTVQTWEAADNTYKLDSRSETVGLARVFAARFGPRIYHSSGTVTERGLEPREFSASVTLRGKADESAARFDWQNNALQFGRTHEQKNTALPAGSQDLLSFMYQLALAPPSPGRFTMPITNGTRFESYDIDVLAEETLDTPLGKLRTLPVKQARRPGRESIEVWLAADYHYLPVRILIVNRDGSRGGEQVATEISLGEK